MLLEEENLPCELGFPGKVLSRLKGNKRNLQDQLFFLNFSSDLFNQTQARKPLARVSRFKSSFVLKEVKVVGWSLRKEIR